ncbi:myosin-IIIa-like isoform X2 [Mizuhopecten yessoensis]|uniref:non-specific serine/threonine protein kinase n=1 Tax=Mizuhopecten yessoensis TaxID=6573 RepID=A0A210QFJ5_MIZYE|nr:myosin-IIIa-like isoform X2 [Mizuhopecten yessoensis]OWF47527.1 Myosin-IIIb [Mizuhopecten yessoensis]
MDGRPALGKVEDLATLAKLDDKVLLEELRARYRNNDIYTYVGDILIAVNPFREIPGLYEDSESQRYFLEQKSSNPPHIFAIADSTYQNIIGYGGRVPHNQCVLISGESGAGKTESTKLIIKQLVELCRGNTQLEQQILQVNPLLESFGNAQTLMNDNSSRFGKYIQLMFKEGHIMGAKISEYLLEKSRVVSQGKNEENFHIFYYMFAGLSKEYKAAHHLQSADKFRYLTNGASSLSRDPALMKSRYEELVNAMDMVGFTDEDQMSTFNMIASVLHLGNVTFDMDDNDAAFVKDEDGAVKVASQLLGINTQEVVGTLTAMVTFTRGEQVKRNYSAEQARDACDAMAKAIYGRLFGWIVNKVNQLLAPPVMHAEHKEIGILDIFGFEHFEKNSFEQACINLANEQLQFFFNQHVFKLEQDEYTKEGIDWTEIKFVDNQPLLNLFLNKPIGILSLLDEETNFPKGSDRSFVDKLDIHFHGNGYYTKSQQSTSGKFTIHHYAGKVTYDSSSWLEKNRDTLPPGVMEMLQGSTDDLVKLMFRGQVTRTGSLALQCRKSTSRRTRRSKKPSMYGRKRKITVGGQFKNSLQILMERMMSSSPVFVRCLKPNHVKVPGKFDETYIRDQLLYTGMLETIKIRREGFAVRPSFPEFVEKYKIILCKPSLEGNKQNCVQILKASKITGWQVGKTRVFMKYYHLEQLSEIFKVMGKSAIHLQRVVRGFLARQYVKVKKQEAQKQAQRLHNFLAQINNLSIEFSNHQHSARVHDESIPASYFTGGENELPPPPVPSFYGVLTPRSSGNKYMDPVAPTSREFGTQADDSDSDQFSDDEFKPVSSTQFGTPGTRQATVKWFKETQAQQVYDPAVSSFIAEWFHGVISRRTSEILLGSKPIGCFLIRVSESRFGYSLSFRGEGRVRHYMIDQLPNKKFVVVGEKKVHRTLKDLADYYSTNHLSNWDGFLSNPCGQEEGDCDYQELIADNYYFKLESQQEPPKRPISSGPRRQQASRVRGSYIPGVPPQRDSTVSGPPIPDRKYTMPNNSAGKSGVRSSTAMSGRPLPKRPDEAHKRLLQNQRTQFDY